MDKIFWDNNVFEGGREIFWECSVEITKVDALQFAQFGDWLRVFSTSRVFLSKRKAQRKYH